MYIENRKTKNGLPWRCAVEQKGVRASRCFPSERQAREWGRITEDAIAKQLEYESVKAVRSKFKHALMGFRTFGDSSLATTEEIIAAAIPVSAICGVYFLIERGEIFYVGQSVNVFTRIEKHRQNGRTFDSFSIIQCKPEELASIEARYIFEHLPRSNQTLNLEALREKRELVALA